MRIFIKAINWSIDSGIPISEIDLDKIYGMIQDSQDLLAQYDLDDER